MRFARAGRCLASLRLTVPGAWSARGDDCAEVTGGGCLLARARVCHASSVAEVELWRVRGDRRLFELEGVRKLRFGGLFSRSATGEAGGRSWRFSRRGFWGRAVEASDLEGARVREFVPSGFRRGGVLRWRDHGLVLRPSSRWRERYALVDGDRELAVVDGKGWGSRSVAISVGDSAVVEPDPRRRGGDLERRAVLARASARAARDGARWVAWAATALAGGRSWRCCSHEP